MGEQETGSGLGKGLQPLAALGFEFNRLHWQRQKQWSLEKLTHNRILREEPQAESRQQRDQHALHRRLCYCEGDTFSAPAILNP